MNITPLMQQYLAVKEHHKDAILMFRLGDFYEMFGDDAKTAAPILEIVLTSREFGDGARMPMCGVPLPIRSRTWTAPCWNCRRLRFAALELFLI